MCFKNQKRRKHLLHTFIEANLTKSQEKNVLFIIRDWNRKIGSQEIPGVTGKFGLGVQNEAGQRLKSSAKRTHWS